MDQLEPPDVVLWDERRLWFEAQASAAERRGIRQPSEQASALLIDLQAVFCAGCWATVVILAAAIVEIQAEGSGQGGADAAELAWLRRRRNALLHERAGDPALTIEDQWTRRPEWEKHARRAVKVLFHALYPERGS